MAVFAVAAAERLGLSDQELLDLRYAAELQPVWTAGHQPGPLQPWLEGANRLLAAEGSSLATQILQAASALVEVLYEEGELVEALMSQGFPAEVVGALTAVQPLIQPVGT